MTTPRQVNQALKNAGLNVEIIRHSSGYYWFDDESTQIASIVTNNLSGFSTAEIVEHVKEELERINWL